MARWIDEPTTWLICRTRPRCGVHCFAGLRGRHALQHSHLYSQRYPWLMGSPYWASSAAAITRRGIKALNIASTCRHAPGCRSSNSSSFEHCRSVMELAPLFKSRHLAIGPLSHRVIRSFTELAMGGINHQRNFPRFPFPQSLNSSIALAHDHSIAKSLNASCKIW